MEDDKLIEELVRDAEKAAEPGVLTAKQVLSEGDADTPPSIVTQVTSAEYVWIYDTRTGDQSKCNRNMLVQHLKKKRPDGSLVFTTKDPGFRPKQGTHKCMLHPDDPNRKHYDELGLPTCKKANLASPFQVRRHMQKRHKQEWATLEQEREDREKEEERAFRRELLGKAVEKPVEPEQAPLYVSNKDRKAQQDK